MSYKLHKSHRTSSDPDSKGCPLCGVSRKDPKAAKPCAKQVS